MYLHVREHIHIIKTGNEWAGLKFNVWYIQYMWITGIFGGELNLVIRRLQSKQPNWKFHQYCRRINLTPYINHTFPHQI